MTMYEVIRLAWFKQVEIEQVEAEHLKKHNNPIARMRYKQVTAKKNELYELMLKYENSDEIIK